MKSILDGVLEKTYRFPYVGRFTRDMDMNVHFTPQIFAGERWERDEDAVAFADYLFEFVCQDVVARFRRACFPNTPAVHLATPLPEAKKKRVSRS